MNILSYNEAMEKAPVVLTLTINNSQPIKLTDFVTAFISLSREYSSTVKASEDFSDEEAEIYVKEIRPDSIVADLIPIAMSVVPLVVTEADKVLLAVETVDRWRERFTALLKGTIPEDASKTDLKTWAGAVASVARDPDASSTLEAATFEDGKREVRAAFTFNSREAKQVEDVIEAEFKRMGERKEADFKRVLMVFTRSDVGDVPVGRPSGERVLIEEISEKPLALTYGSELAEERIKHEIRESDDNIFKKGFNVDVRVQTSGGRPVAYSIMEVHGVIELPE